MKYYAVGIDKFATLAEAEEYLKDINTPILPFLADFAPIEDEEDEDEKLEIVECELDETKYDLRKKGAFYYIVEK